MDAVSTMKVEETSSTKPSHHHLHHPSDHVFNLLGPVGPLTAAFSRRCLSMSLLSFGQNLLRETGFVVSLGSAVYIAKVYTVSSSIYCLFHVALARIRRKQDELNGVLAGCSMGLITSSLGLGFPPLWNCMLWGTAGVVDFDSISRRTPANVADETISSSPTCVSTVPDETISSLPTCVSEFINNVKNTCPLLRHKLPNSPLVSCIKILAKRIFMSATFGTVMGYTLYMSKGTELSTLDLFVKKGPIASFQSAGSLTKFSAIAGGVLALSFLVLRELQGKSDGIQAGLFGCVSALFLPQAYGSPSALLARCLGSAAFCASIEGMITDRDMTFLPHFPPKKNEFGADGVLPPFTLPLPKNIEDGFSNFHESLEKGSKKA